MDKCYREIGRKTIWTYVCMFYLFPMLSCTDTFASWFSPMVAGGLICLALMVCCAGIGGGV